MSLYTNTNERCLWQEVVQDAEIKCSVKLEQELESYLVSLLSRYSKNTHFATQIYATAFLEAMQKKQNERMTLLREVGDGCLLFAGLFPKAHERRLVKINYFVDIGRSAYAAISHKTSDLYASLAFQFVVLMDILQSIRPSYDLSPFEAYERFESLGSQHALKVLQSYSSIIPLNQYKK